MGFQFKEWYQQNGERLNQSRRDRYKTDPGYKEQVLERNRASRLRRRETVKKEKREEKAATKVKVIQQPWKTVDHIIEVEGNEVTVQMLTIGAVAKVVGRSVQAVRLWEKQGKFPTTPYHNAKGDRLYTPEMVEGILEKMQKSGKIEAAPTKVRYNPRGLRCSITLADGSKKIDTMFRIGVLALHLNRTVITVEQMEQKGYIPETPFRGSSTSYRLYTLEMIEAARTSIETREDLRGAEQWKIVHDEILEKWKQLGIIGATFKPVEK